MSTPLFEIALPLHSNEGRDYADALRAWEVIALDVVGGFSRRPDGHGVWKCEADGKTYTDVMRPYRVACHPQEFDKLIDAALKLFPDQVAIYTATIGRAVIYNRKDVSCIASNT